MKERMVQDMLAGGIEPLVVATARVRGGLVSPPAIRVLDGDIKSFVETGVFISSEMGTAIFSDGSNLKLIAERLARYNYHAATLASTDPDLIADAAYTLFRVLDASSANLEERRRLIGEFHPTFRARPVPPSMLFSICVSAVSVYSTSTRIDEAYFRDVRQYGTEALQHADEMGLRSSEDLCYVRYWLGVALNEIEATEIKAREISVRLLERCIEDEQHCRDQFRGSALNSLGYSLLLLGRLMQDRQTVLRAIDTFHQALPHRVGGQEIQLTRKNLAIAERALGGEAASAAATEGARLDRRIGVAKEIFTEVVSSDLEPSQREELLTTAMNHLLDVAGTLEVGADPRLRARLELAFGLGLVCSGDSAGAVCFLRAAARKLDRFDDEDSLPRRAAAYYNLGLAFSAMKGLADQHFYVPRAIENFEYAKEWFAALGLEERARICTRFIERSKERLRGS